MVRAELAAAAAGLRAQGKLQREIAAELGISKSYAEQLLNDPDGSKAKARKASYGGVCVRCGGRTDGSNGRAQAPRLCASCSQRKQHEERYWTAARVLEAIRRFEREHGRPPHATDWISRRPRWAPTVGTVQREFGSWANAIEAAGFPRPTVGGYERTPETRAKLSAAHRVYSDEQLLDAIRAFVAEHDRVPVHADTSRNGLPHFSTYHRRFGRWSRAVELAGYTPKRGRPPRTPSPHKEKKPCAS